MIEYTHHSQPFHLAKIIALQPFGQLLEIVQCSLFKMTAILYGRSGVTTQ